VRFRNAPAELSEVLEPSNTGTFAQTPAGPAGRSSFCLIPSAGATIRWVVSAAEFVQIAITPAGGRA
jgi:hypothetical protein